MTITTSSSTRVKPRGPRTTFSRTARRPQIGVSNQLESRQARHQQENPAHAHFCKGHNQPLSVRIRKAFNLGAQRLFLALQLFEARSPRGELGQELTNRRRYRSCKLGSPHARFAIGFIVKCNCDILHVSTVTQRLQEVNVSGPRRAYFASVVS